MPARLPDDRTPEQIGGKVAEVLWNHFEQQGAPSAAVVPAVSSAATQAYDDAYADTLLADSRAPAPTAPAFTQIITRPAAPERKRPQFQIYQRFRQPAAVPAMSVTAPVRLPLPVQQQAAPPEATPLPAARPQLATIPIDLKAAAVEPPRVNVVQLGFLDGSTVDLASDHPAAKALRAAALALTVHSS